MANSLPYIPFYISEYLADTNHLTTLQHGAYLLLIMNYWQRGKALNNKSNRLANACRLDSKTWEENKEVLAEFFEIDGDLWIHNRVERDLARVREKSEKRKAAGKQGGKARKAKAKQKLSKRSAKEEQVPIYKDKDKDSNTPPIIPPKGDGEGVKDSSFPANENDQLFNDPLEASFYRTFWPNYPWQYGEKAALEAWRALAPSYEVVQEMMTALSRQRMSDRWKKENGRFIMQPERWIREEHWKDAEAPGNSSDPEVTELINEITTHEQNTSALTDPERRLLDLHKKAYNGQAGTSNWPEEYKKIVGKLIDKRNLLLSRGRPP